MCNSLSLSLMYIYVYVKQKKMETFFMISDMDERKRGRVFVPLKLCVAQTLLFRILFLRSSYIIWSSFLSWMMYYVKFSFLDVMLVESNITTCYKRTFVFSTVNQYEYGISITLWYNALFEFYHNACTTLFSHGSPTTCVVNHLNCDQGPTSPLAFTSCIF